MNDTMSKEPDITSDVESPGLPPKRRRWRVVLLGIIILVCGVAIGAGGTVVIMRHTVLHAIQHPEEAPQRIADRVRKKLGISDEKAVRIEEILSERQKKIQALRRQVQPQIDDELNQAREEVAALLNPEQAAKWRERFDKLRMWFPALPMESNSGKTKKN
ncbi:hypothetical protein [Desulfomonile tiedjei]|uniref:Periplasmic heavy metal sensor n=1 Tax=Desulfomonile tiedjei (strain ATCC 49306 / DSM 6799 / DCB-1) TaxID=706587 RepID=I4C616_DESTA|nr:hypothetical protein [Desulfomonile tiedjei]AFM25007.1 hypothetical protein Desti_2320 [Desulfomonile tiedjei DSM 6799]